jgi:hypothetical protein
MQHSIRQRVADGAKALRSRAFVTLLAILTLCATPLGAGDLFAASSHIFERVLGEARQGDLPRRVATPCANAQTDVFETVAQTVATAALVDDTPDAIASRGLAVDAHDYRRASFPAPVGIFGGARAGFEARGPPLG